MPIHTLFARSDEGAENWAMLASLIETCKLQDVNPEAFPADNRGTRYARPYGRFRNNRDVLRYFGASFAFGKTVMSGQLRWRSHSL
jgi:hypothetical protein